MVSVSLVTIIFAACSDGSEDRFAAPPPVWTWTDLRGPPAATSEYVGNHEPLLVLDDTLLLGTSDGVWRRPLSGTAEWQRAGLDGLAIHAVAANSDGSRIIAAGFDPGDETGPTAWYSTDSGLSWIPAAEWPRGEPGSPEGEVSFRFYALEPDPVDADVIYGNLDADTVAVTVDGGATWLMANGVTSPNFGYACVPYRPSSRPILLQGCEVPLDVAWVGARRVIEVDRFQLPDFRYVYGRPHSEELRNRRINSIAAPSRLNDRVLVGVEGGLVLLTSTSGLWTGLTDTTAEWLFRREVETGSPYPYIRAIATLDADGHHVLFGGPLQDDNLELSLYETTNNGRTVWQLDAPFELYDPRIEQAWRLEATDVLLVIGQIEPNDPRGSMGPHSPKVYRLRRP